MTPEMIEKAKENAKKGKYENVEFRLPIECMVNDPTAKAIIENLKVPTKNLNEVANSVVSIKVYGVKPNKTI